MKDGMSHTDEQRRGAGIAPMARKLAPMGGLGLLLLACWFLFFHRLAERDLWSSHEARAAQDAQSLLDDQWALPHLFDRKVELQKPPLYYWLVAALARLRGGTVDAWTVRMPAAAAALLSVLLVFALGIARGRTLAGFVAAVVLATALHFTWLARTGRIDMPLTGTVGLALTTFYLGHCRLREQEGRGAWHWFLCSYLLAGLAVLLKGPIGLILPAAVVLGFLVLEGKKGSTTKGSRPLFSRYGVWWGVPLLLTVALPWYLWANVQTGGALFHVFFWEHNVERGLGGGSLRGHPWWFYLPRLSLDFLPWSPLLLLAAWWAWRRACWREDAEFRFGVVWLAAMLLALSCARFKRADYLLPAYPGAALLLGAMAERLRRPQFLGAGFALVLLAWPLGWSVYLDREVAQQDALHETRQFAEQIRQVSPAPQLILFFRAESHALAFHVGRPIDTLLEWENLDYWVGRPEIYHVVMPAEYARQWPQNLKAGRLELVLCSNVLAGARHDDPLVLLRTRPGAAPPAP
jgi:4-amino-4-deoxy-L-arabinose transferase-like glycosyltransferase